MAGGEGAASEAGAGGNAFVGSRAQWPPSEGAPPRKVAVGFMVVMAQLKAVKQLSAEVMTEIVATHKDVPDSKWWSALVPDQWHHIRQ